MQIGGGEVRSAVEQAYDLLKAMATSFELRPGEKLNEASLSWRLGISRTPLREALNRLASDGYLSHRRNVGFSRRSITLEELTQLYEIWEALHRTGALLVVQRASSLDLKRMSIWLASLAGVPAQEEAILDGLFLDRLVELSGNRELRLALGRLKGRLEFVHRIGLERRREQLRAEQLAIVEALRRRDRANAETLLAAHVTLNHAELVEAVCEAHARIGAREQIPRERPLLRAVSAE